MSAATRNGSSAASAPPATRTFRHRQPATWWLHNRRYLLYMVREFSAIPIALWMVLLLVEIAGVRRGSQGYQPLGGPLFVAVSLVCLAFALYHTFTFLNLAGLIMRIPLGERAVPGRVIVLSAFGGLFVVSAVVIGLLVWGGL